MRVEAYETDDGRIDLRWWIDTDALWHVMEMDGRYLLVTNDFTLSLRQMIELYRAKDGVEIGLWTNFALMPASHSRAEW